MSDYGTRFGALGRLYGTRGLARLRGAHCMVVGLGGVGSWVVESLARSGLGQLSLVDFDDVCLSNVNRQSHALEGTIGRPKAQVLGERVARINPECTVHVQLEFFTAATAERLLAARPDLVVDAIDDVANKCLLLARCREHGLPVITCGGAGGRRDPARIETKDLVRSRDDPLLSKLRKLLRQNHGFSSGKRKWQIPCVYSTEPPRYPWSDGSVCATREPMAGTRLNCESGFGTASFVTGAFGFHLAALAVDLLSAEPSAIEEKPGEVVVHAADEDLVGGL